MIRSSRLGYVVLAWGIVLAVLAQVSLIGLWLFAAAPTMALHKEFGHAITLMVLVLSVLAFTGQLPSALRRTTVLLAVLSVVQTEVFALIPGSSLRAFHPVLAIVIFFVVAVLAQRALPLVRDRPEVIPFRVPSPESRAN